MKNLVARLLKSKAFIYFIIALVIGIVSTSVSYFSLSVNGKYVIGTTLERSKRKHGDINVKYEYLVNDQKYWGNFSENNFFYRTRKLEVPNGKYLVIYSTSWPNWSQLVDEYPVTEFTNIDSLNAAGVDKNLIKFWE